MDKAPVVASAVLVSALHLLGNNAEIVKRWTNEIQEAVNSKSNMVQVCYALPTVCADLGCPKLSNKAVQRCLLFSIPSQAQPAPSKAQENSRAPQMWTHHSREPAGEGGV